MGLYSLNAMKQTTDADDESINAGETYKIGSREYTVKGMTRSGKVCLKTDSGITKWATISELTE